MTARNRKKDYVILVVILLLLLVVAAFCGYYLIREYMTAQKAENVFESMRSDAVNEEAASDAEKAAEANFDGVGEPEENIPRVYITALSDEYPQVIGWIKIDDTDIDYPIVQAADNEYYLTHLPDGSENRRGSVFADCNSAPDFSDSHTIIYGHNMRDGSMFGNLDMFRDADYYKSHRYGYLFTKDKVYRVELFDVATVESYDALTKIAQPDSEEKIITLATCSYETDAARLVVTGRLIDITHEKTDKDADYRE